MLSESAGHCSGDALDAALGNGVSGEEVFLHQVAAGTDIDNRTAVGGDHCRRHRLNGEEVVTQVYGKAVVPVVGRHFLPGVAVIACSVVHQYLGGTLFGVHRGNSGAQALDVGEVAFNKAGRVLDVVVGAHRQRGGSTVGVDVDERNLCGLLGELVDDGLSNAASTTGNEDPFVFERRVGRVVS